MPLVELIYDGDCPNVWKAREVLRGGFAALGLPAAWIEWERNAPGSPSYARQYGSPTILVDGRDIAGAEPGDGANACRLYRVGSGVFSGVPPVECLVAALGDVQISTHGSPAKGRGQWSFLAALPAVGASLFPLGACPACWPAYAGLMSSLGLGFLLEATYFLPVALALFGLALFALAYRATSRRGYGPFALGVVSAALVLVFKFVYLVGPMVYLGLFGLICASCWNAWPRRNETVAPCATCIQKTGEPDFAAHHNDRKEVNP